MGQLINASLLILGTIAILTGLSFYIKEKKAGIIRVFLPVSGLLAAMWCYCFAFMGMYTDLNVFYLSRMLGLVAIDGYLLCLMVSIAKLIRFNKYITRSFIVVYSLLAIGDVILFSPMDHIHVVVTDGRTSFTNDPWFGSTYHYVFLSVAVLMLFVVGFTWLFSKKTTHNKKFVLIMVCAHLFLMVSTIPDTFLPTLNIPYFPSTCYGVMVSYLITWYNCVHNNALAITLQNVSDYIFQGTNVNILVLDMAKKLYLGNDAAYKFFEIKEDADIGLSDMFDISAEQAEWCLNDVLKGTISELRLRTRRENKSCALHFTVGKDKKDTAYCIVIFVYDLTKEEEMLEELKKANDAKSDFLSHMSHEIRTPINAIIGMNEMVLRESNDENITEYANSIRSSSHSLLAIINDVLDISKIESGKMEIVESDYELSSLVVDCYNMIIERVRENGLTLHIDCNEQSPNQLYGDISHMRQIIMNLLTNAVKYTENGDIYFRVAVDKQKEMLNITVEDSGIGIAKENIDKLFGKFERFDLHKNRNIEGAGLGLNIVQSVVALMNGTISVESEYGKGSVFTVCIPQRIVDPTPVGKINIGSMAVVGADYTHKCGFIAPQAKILVVDDVPVNLNVFVNLVKDHKMQVDTALSGQECLALTKQKKYDIIFMDHMMPGMDGIETLTAIKADEDNPNIDTSVIMLTANALIGMKDIYLQNGFTDYLSKPIAPDKLDRVIDSYLSDDKKIEVTEEQNIADVKEESEAVVVSSSEPAEDPIGNIKDPLERLKVLVPDVNINMAIRYCAGNKDLYIEFLRDYATDGRYERIATAYQDMELKTYTIEVHTLKSTSRTLGFDGLAKLAEELQHAAERSDIETINSLHGDMMVLYEKILSALKKLSD